MNIEISNFYYDFLKFLKKNDCFDKFKNNWYSLKRRSHRGFEKDNCYNFKLYFNPTIVWQDAFAPWYYYCRSVIYDSFNWNKTSEGFDYWYNIDDLWREYFFENCYIKINGE